MQDIGWNLCSDKMPVGSGNEVSCLVICREWDIFERHWSREELRILAYNLNHSCWNTKSDIQVKAWMYTSPLIAQYKNMLSEAKS